MIYFVYGFNIISNGLIKKYNDNIQNEIINNYPILRVYAHDELLEDGMVILCKDSKKVCQEYHSREKSVFKFIDGRSIVVTKDRIDLYGGVFDDRLLGGADIIVASRLNNRSVLHGGAILYKDKAFLFCANSGAGKSTLLSAFTMYNNVSILTDDIICISEDGKTIFSGLQQVSLNVDSLEFFKKMPRISDLMTPLFSNIKTTLKSKTESILKNSKYDIGGVFFLKERKPDCLIEIKSLDKSAFFTEMIKNIKMVSALNDELLQSEFDILYKLANRNVFGVSLRINNSFSNLQRVTNELISFIDKSIINLQ